MTTTRAPVYSLDRNVVLNFERLPTFVQISPNYGFNLEYGGKFMRDWRSNRVKFIRFLKKFIFYFSYIVGIYKPRTKLENETKPCEGVIFFGSRPGISDAIIEREEHRREFLISPLAEEHVLDLRYSPSGKAWHHGSLIERYSVHRLQYQKFFPRQAKKLPVAFRLVKLLKSIFRIPTATGFTAA